MTIYFSKKVLENKTTQNAINKLQPKRLKKM